MTTEQEETERLAALTERFTARADLATGRDIDHPGDEDPSATP